jgi:hypothetical protein
MKLDISAPTIMNSNNLYIQHFTLLPKYDPAWTIVSTAIINTVV